MYDYLYTTIVGYEPADLTVYPPTPPPPPAE